MTPERRNVLLLAGAQALFQTATIMLLTMAALVGQMLADDKRLATLPIAMSVASTALCLIPAALFMQRYGRKAGFYLGVLCGALSGLGSAYAIAHSNFWLFVATSMLMGTYQSFAQYYRFAAADVASPAFKSRAISWVIAGGVVAAIAGPNLARFTRDLSVTPFLASYLALAALSVVATLVIAVLQLPKQSAANPQLAANARPLREIMRQPVFITALTGSAVGFGVMIMVMTATPLAMQFCGQPLAAATNVIQWHVLGMFLPSFFTGNLIRRFGVLTIMQAGVWLTVLHVLIALSGIEYLHFLSGLVLLGIGWNFLFIGGTTLLTEAYRPGEQGRTQGAHDFLMFIVVSLGSFSAGGLLNAWGWQAVNLATLPFLALALLALTWLQRQRS